MKLFASYKTALIALLSGALALSACSSDQVIDTTVDVAAGATKVVAKGAFGAGKMVYRGVSGDDE